jgi:hypothetical protein
MRKKEMTVREMAAMGGRASAAKRDPEQQREQMRRNIELRWSRTAPAAQEVAAAAAPQNLELVRTIASQAPAGQDRGLIARRALTALQAQQRDDLARLLAEG